MRLYCFKSRSFRLPNIFLRRPVTMTFARKFKPQSLAPRRASANARTALDCVEKNTPLGQLLQNAQNTLDLQKAIALSLNKNGLEMAIPHIKVGAFSEETGILKLFSPNAALSTRLQQKLPSILFKLQELGWPVQAIELKQAPGGAGIGPEKPHLPPEPAPIFSPKAQESWEKLLPTLEIGSPLRQAVEKLIKSKKLGK